MRLRTPRLPATVLVLSLALAGAAHAEGLYVGGALGVPDNHGTIAGVDGNGNGTGLKIYGGWQLNPYFALEANTFSLGRIEGNGDHVDTRGLSLDAVGRYELAPRWSVLGSAGLARARFSTTDDKEGANGLKLGVGVEYALTPSTALRLGYDRYHFSNVFDSNANVGQTNFGVKFNF